MAPEDVQQMKDGLLIAAAMVKKQKNLQNGHKPM